ncbi:MAG TPA: tetratricopeptide repeat protein [Thermoanaerobaculia bacterium]|nr:tetratricopeptide repeat protein [Thermoanaerobaculia bacterium]
MLGSVLAGVFACGGCFGFLPMILAAVALIDSIRTGAGWYWCLIILAMPVIGPIAYFVVVRSALLGSHSAAFMSHSTARRLQARRHLKALQVQLGHWRGPGVLTEAGEDLLVLGKNKEAEAHFREALENGAAVEDVHFGLAQALQPQGRFADAVPYLEQLVAVEPDARLGEGPLALARCLDESGRREEAVPVLRRVLERRTVIEAQVRLARILLQQGKKEEAGPLLAEVAADAKSLPSYLKRRYRGWIRAARGLRPGTTLPRPRVDGAVTVREGLRAAGIAVGAAFLLLVGVLYLWNSAMRMPSPQSTLRDFREIQQLHDRLETLDKTWRWTHGDDLAVVDLTAGDVDRYLRVRRGLESVLREIARQESELRQQRAAAQSSPGFGTILTASSAPGRGLQHESFFLRTLIAELEREEMSPHELGNLVALIDWRFLRRSEALAFGLPEYQRADWVNAQRELAIPVELLERGEDDRSARRYRKQHALLRAKVEAMEKEASAAVDLSPASRTLLESRRAEVEAFDPGFLQRILLGVESSLASHVGWAE